MPEPKSQKKFYIDPHRGKVWENLLSRSGMTQSKAMETLIDALEAELIDLNELRVELTKLTKASSESE